MCFIFSLIIPRCVSTHYCARCRTLSAWAEISPEPTAREMIKHCLTFFKQCLILARGFGSDEISARADKA